MVGRNVLIGLNLYEIAKKYKASREEPLPFDRTKLPEWSPGPNVDLATYERRYPKGLFNKGVRANNEDHVGHVMKETEDKIVIFGDYNYRFDVPKSTIKGVGRNVILNMDFSELATKYKVDRNAPLPTGEPVEKINDEAYQEAHSHYKGIREEKRTEKFQYKKITRRPRLVSRKVEGHKEDDDGERTNIMAKSIANMIMGSNNANNARSKNKLSPAIAPLEIVDTQTLVARTQDRMWKALEGRYLYDSSLKDSQNFLFNHVNSKISLVILYADLVGSTSMSMTLPVDKMVTIIRAFTYEITSIVYSHEGYVLKFVGDAII